MINSTETSNILDIIARDFRSERMPIIEVLYDIPIFKSSEIVKIGKSEYVVSGIKSLLTYYDKAVFVDEITLKDNDVYTFIVHHEIGHIKNNTLVSSNPNRYIDYTRDPLQDEYDADRWAFEKLKWDIPRIYNALVTYYNLRGFCDDLYIDRIRYLTKIDKLLNNR